MSENVNLESIIRPGRVCFTNGPLRRAVVMDFSFTSIEADILFIVCKIAMALLKDFYRFTYSS